MNGNSIFRLDSLINGLSKGIFVIMLYLFLFSRWEMAKCSRIASGKRKAYHDPDHIKGNIRQLNSPGVFRIYNNLSNSAGINTWCIGSKKCLHNIRHHIENIVLYGDPVVILIPSHTDSFVPYGSNLEMAGFEPGRNLF